jgi:hypothetical protein
MSLRTAGGEAISDCRNPLIAAISHFGPTIRLLRQSSPRNDGPVS